ncbi:hypothetical protein CRENBAI_008641 [Crenichthys baileyi]|uniref:G-protein coupled receptors family 1 profile domain-containing protein n=1 Tax=Crenichthys baileyi TaxID=28760 RepID=A0AAV9RMP4_9TELE
MSRVLDTLSGNFNKIFLPTLYGIKFTLGIVGNRLVVLVVGYQKTVKTTTDKYLLHLSVADLLCVLTLPFGLWTLSRHGTSEVSSAWRCTSVLILALDEYLAAVPAIDRKLLAGRVIYVGAWLPAAILTVPDLVFARVQDVQDISSSGYLFAEDSVESTGSSAIYQRIYLAESGLTWMAVFRFQHFLVGFILPGVVILVCYCRVLQLRGAAGGGDVDLRHRSPGLLPLLPGPHPLCLPGCEVQPNRQEDASDHHHHHRQQRQQQRRLMEPVSDSPVHRVRVFNKGQSMTTPTSTMKGAADGFLKLPVYVGSEEIVFSPDSSGSSDILGPNQPPSPRPTSPYVFLLILFVGSAVSEQERDEVDGWMDVFRAHIYCEKRVASFLINATCDKFLRESCGCDTGRSSPN